MTAIKSYVAEFIGTLILMIGGVGTAVLASGNVGFLGVALGFGLTLAFLVYAIGPISGCHINPAVTVGLALTGKIAVVDAIGYIIAQCLGAIAGGAIVLGIASGSPGYNNAAQGLGANGYAEHSPEGYSMSSVFGLEVALTFILVFVVLAATDRIGTAALAGIAIGFTLAVVHLVGIPVSNTSVNPARSLGAAVFSGGDAMGQLWLFWLAPLLGGAAGAIVYNLLFGLDKVTAEGHLNVDGRHEDDPLDRTPDAVAAPAAPAASAADPTRVVDADARITDDPLPPAR